MCPPQPALETRSQAERQIFDAIKHGLDDNWVGLHSLGLVAHPRKPWAEIDFVVIGPPGVYCLEVKGQRVSRRDGEWVFTNRHGVEGVKHEGPFEQVASASAVLNRYVSDHAPQIRTIVGYGVLTPDMVFDIPGPDVEPAVVYDARDADAPFERYMKRLATYWMDRIRRMKSHTPEHLSAEHVGDLFQLLRPDFDGRPSLRAQAGATNQELLRLTGEQFRTLDGLTENMRVFVKGGAGTGKTLLAVEEAKRLARLGRRVLLTCFNRRLADYTSAAVSQYPNTGCENLHAFMRRVVHGTGLESELPKADEADLFAVFYPQLCVRALHDRAEGEQFDALVVDESQDLLRDEYVEVFAAALRGGLEAGTWRMFFDPRQNLFEGSESGAMGLVLAYEPAQFKLTLNCRNTAPIATATQLLTDSRSDDVLVADGPDVRIQWYAEESNQRAMIETEIARLTTGGISRDDIVVLSRVRDAAAMASLSTSPRRLTVGAFKGLEADSVLLTHVDDLMSRESRVALYVGSSRARVFLTVFMSEAVRGDYQELATRFGRVLGRHALAT